MSLMPYQGLTQRQTTGRHGQLNEGKNPSIISNCPFLKRDHVIATIMCIRVECRRFWQADAAQCGGGQSFVRDKFQQVDSRIFFLSHNTSP